MKNILLIFLAVSAMTTAKQCGCREVITKQGKFKAAHYDNWKPKKWSLSGSH